ncbi:MAG: response regulator transcription factor [Lachnospiraceae bacterium]|nr:response regulator transcription factor [Lachnospiraceae bacterium]
MTRVLIVEDAPMDRQLLELYVKQSGQYELVPSVESAAFVEFCCRTTRVDLILMDVCTSLYANGIDAAEKIKQNFPQTKIIIITGQPECSFIERAKKAGVDSFWYKTETAESILHVMERTMAGENIYPESTPPLQFGYITSNELTARELEVLREVVAGESDAAIAEKLYMSLRTVKCHIQSMRDKTGFRNRTELAVRARDCGLIIVDKETE